MTRRFSKRVTSTKRWQGLRLEALRRDGWKCVQCGKAGRLEVDHIKPVRTHPHLAFELANLQCLCPTHHTDKTRIEMGYSPISPERHAWRKLLRDMQRTNQAKGEINA